MPKRAKVAAFVHYQKMKGDARSAIGAGSPHCVFKSSHFFSLEGSGTGARFGAQFNEDTAYVLNGPNERFRAGEHEVRDRLTTNLLLELAPGPGQPDNFSSEVIGLGDTHGCTGQDFPVMQPTFRG